jgi:hypothetical protein
VQRSSIAAVSRPRSRTVERSCSTPSRIRHGHEPRTQPTMTVPGRLSGAARHRRSGARGLEHVHDGTSTIIGADRGLRPTLRDAAPEADVIRPGVWGRAAMLAGCLTRLGAGTPRRGSNGVSASRAGVRPTTLRARGSPS